MHPLRRIPLFFALTIGLHLGTATSVCAIDCNSNGVNDASDIAAGTSQDCQSNGVPDECDIAKGTSADCNSNGVPDECPVGECPPIDLVFVLDTSGSMDTLDDLCSVIDAVTNDLVEGGLTVNVEILTISADAFRGEGEEGDVGTGGLRGDCDCCTDGYSVPEFYGKGK